MKARIYVDASVVGGCEDDEFAAHSLRLMESLVRGDFALVLSTLTVQELAAAPAADSRVQLRESPQRVSASRNSGTQGGVAE
jgi:hypothetical protein